METSFSHLPQEVLSHILSFLDVPHRLSAGLVCKSWLQASDTSMLLEDACITVCSRNCLQRLLGTTRKFPNLTIRFMEVNDEHIDLLSRLGPHLLHLCFHDCWASTSLSSFAECPNLISLKVEGDADFLIHFSPLHRLRRLNLRHTSTLTDMIFTPLDDIVGLNLDTFSISNEVVWDPKVCKRFRLKGSRWEGKSDAILSCDTIESFIMKRAKTLTDLEFPEWISGEAAVRLSKIAGLSLQRISFRSCQQCCKGVLPEVCRNQPLLVSIDVSGQLFLSDEDIIGICQVLPNLQRFIARTCPHLDTCIPYLFRLKHLREVDLDGCCGITPASFTAAVDTFQSQKLQCLRLGRTKVQDAHLDNLLIRMPQLKRLDLDFCSGISDRMNVPALFRHLSKLQELRICMQMEDSEEAEGKENELGWEGWPTFALFTRDTVMEKS